MRQIVECVPNFSEGRNEDVIRSIADAILSIGGIKILDIESDRDHNRSVITFIGPPEGVKKAAFASASKAVELIDMEKHTGQHPRIGAVDVIPFIPIKNVSMEDCITIVREIGQEIAEELNVPVYLYEEAATRPDRKNLADVRKGEYEGLKKEIIKEYRMPDFGKPEMHSTAGAVAIGARWPLIAFNVNLATGDINIAKKIARAVREKNGGLLYVKAMGFELKNRGIVQVSMNLVNYKSTPIYRAYELVKIEAKKYGVNIIGTEIIGLLPLEAMVETFLYYMSLEKFSTDQILEWRLWENE